MFCKVLSWSPPPTHTPLWGPPALLVLGRVLYSTQSQGMWRCSLGVDDWDYVIVCFVCKVVVIPVFLKHVRYFFSRWDSRKQGIEVSPSDKYVCLQYVPNYNVCNPVMSMKSLSSHFKLYNISICPWHRCLLHSLRKTPSPVGDCRQNFWMTVHPVSKRPHCVPHWV